ncbi:MAG: zinc ribbon domain-containing protein [Deltaproteobacteria bacterium]|jgi:putative FmdB family regulatory protein|nr:zinc ribbon domain-containing protein [Deltaproteobacteria bacterium]
MPIYEFKCSRCGLEFETLVMRSREPAACPDCGYDQCEKHLSAFSFGSSSGSRGDFGSYAQPPSGGSGCGSCSSSSCAGCGSR